jgi:hypothetical protein
MASLLGDEVSPAASGKISRVIKETNKRAPAAQGKTRTCLGNGAVAVPVVSGAIRGRLGI